MKSLEEVIDYIAEGSIILIKKEIIYSNVYSVYILKYDGSIFRDVKLVNLGNMLAQIPNIKDQLDSGLFYHAAYDFEQKQYTSTIINKDRIGKYHRLIPIEIKDVFQASGSDFLESMIELDTRIAKKINEKEVVSNKRLLVS